MLCFLIARSPPRATRTDTLCPYTTRVRSGRGGEADRDAAIHRLGRRRAPVRARGPEALHLVELPGPRLGAFRPGPAAGPRLGDLAARVRAEGLRGSEEHTSDLQSLMRISYAVFCSKKNTTSKSVEQH